MENKEKRINQYFSVILPIAVIALVLSIYQFPAEKASVGLFALSAVTVFFSSYLRIQLPRTKIHLTISDALIILSLIIYGGPVSVLLAALETAYTSLSLRRQGISIKTKTVCLNVAISVTAVFVTAVVVGLLFGAPEAVVRAGSHAEFVALLSTMALTLFIINSVSVSYFISLKNGQSLWQVWHDYCLNALVMYLTGAVLAGLAAKALQQIDMILFAAAIAFFALAYMTYKRYVDDVKEAAAKAEQAERERAEQAERHIVELQHHIAEQERIGNALRESKDKFRHAAFHDALTGLSNRMHFVENLQALLDHYRAESERKMAVLFLDLNRFKTINDSLGHSAGDRLIQHVAKRLSSLMRPDDLVARFGGDEFAIILKDLRRTEEAVAFAEAVRQKISTPFTINGRQVFTSVSVGIAVGRPGYELAEDVLRDADIAMYQAKENHQGSMVFDQTMHIRAVTRMQLETDLRHAVERDELIVYYQPIIDLATMSLNGFEALMRWRHPQRGIVPPNEFIPLAEETGLIVPLTLWILRESCRQTVEWQRRSPRHRPLMVSVNLSGRHFEQSDIVGQVRGVIEETGIDPTCLKLELTESAVMENAERTITLLKQLRALGVQLSIDDFGTGYSSLSYLHRFPINMLKVDRSFVGSMEEGSENGEIVRTIISLAKTLNLNVVAEGIESIHQLHQLRILGCEYGQGFLFSRPVPAAEIESMLEDENRWQMIVPDNNPAILAQNREFTRLRLAK